MRPNHSHISFSQTRNLLSTIFIATSYVLTLVFQALENTDKIHSQ